VSAADPQWLETEGERLLGFGRAAVAPTGFGWLSTTGTLEDRPLELWITCRMTHVFAVAHLLGHEGAGDLVDHGVAALRGAFHDDEHGGWFAQVDEGGPVTTGKACYPHDFVVLAASSAVAAERPGARALLDEAVEVLLARFWDDEHGMLVEEWDRGWTRLDGYRGVNANMHGVEALLAAADVLDDASLRERALRITTRVVGDLAPAHGWRLPEHFDADWVPQPDHNRENPADPFRPFGATIGHALEWSRLALHLHAALGADAPAFLLENARSLFDQAVREGWDVDGRPGFVYTTDWEGTPVVRERMHWVVAEAVGAAAALSAATGDPSYDAWGRTWWQHVEDCFVDRAGGSWWHELSPDLVPSSVVWEGKPDLYHAYQATLFSRLPLAPSMATAAARGLLSPGA
jgi:sulfoquinovose isomerase